MTPRVRAIRALEVKRRDRINASIEHAAGALAEVYHLVCDGNDAGHQFWQPEGAAFVQERLAHVQGQLDKVSAYITRGAGEAR